MNCLIVCLQNEVYKIGKTTHTQIWKQREFAMYGFLFLSFLFIYLFFFSFLLSFCLSYTISPWARRGQHAPPSATCTNGIILIRGLSWLRTKILTLDILGSTRHFGWFSKWPPQKLKKVIYSVISACYHLICLLLWDKHQYLKTWNLFLIFKAKTYVLKCYFQDGRQFETQFSQIFIKVQMTKIYIPVSSLQI